jgi:hypothetical protein
LASLVTTGVGSAGLVGSRFVKKAIRNVVRPMTAAAMHTIRSFWFFNSGHLSLMMERIVAEFSAGSDELR